MGRVIAHPVYLVNLGIAFLVELCLPVIFAYTGIHLTSHFFLEGVFGNKHPCSGGTDLVEVLCPLVFHSLEGTRIIVGKDRYFLSGGGCFVYYWLASFGSHLWDRHSK